MDDDDFDDFLDANPWCMHVIVMGLFVIALVGVFWPEKYVRDRDWSSEDELQQQRRRQRWGCGLGAVLLPVIELTLVSNGLW